MAIAKFNQTKVKEEVPTHKDTVPWVDTVSGYDDSTNLYEVGGFTWLGTYFQGLREEDDIADTIDVRIDGSYQQFKRIEDFPLKLQSELSYAIVNETKESNLSTEVILTDVLVPNNGDIFVSQRTTTKIGLFTISEVERLSPFNNSAYKAKLTLIEESNKDDINVRLENLIKKVVATQYYQENYLYLNSKPLLTKEEVGFKEDKLKLATRLSRDYTLRHFNKRTDTYLVIEGDKVLYDPYLVKFLHQTLRSSLQGRIYDCEDAGEMTIFDNLITRDKELSSLIMDKVEVYRTMKGQDLLFAYGLHYTKVNRILTSADKEHATFIGQGTTVSCPRYSIDSQFNLSDANEVYPDLSNGTYIVSEDFYNGGDVTTLFDDVVTKWLNDEAIGSGDVEALVSGLNDLTPLEYYYFVPVIIFLLNN